MRVRGEEGREHQHIIFLPCPYHHHPLLLLLDQYYPYSPPWCLPSSLTQPFPMLLTHCSHYHGCTITLTTQPPSITTTSTSTPTPQTHSDSPLSISHHNSHHSADWCSMTSNLRHLWPVTCSQYTLATLTVTMAPLTLVHCGLKQITSNL